MRPSTRPIAVILVALMLTPAPFATCGGGGGGGMGGATAGGGMPQQQAEVYHVPWKVLGPGAPKAEGSLVVYWLPTSAAEARSSDLMVSRYLTLTSAQCIGMAIITTDNADLRGKFSGSADGPSAVLASPEGKEIARVSAAPGKLEAADVEEMLRKEIDQRKKAVQQSLDAAKEKSSANDVDGAAAIYHEVWEQRCLFPESARKAVKALKKMGRPIEESETSSLEAPAPNLSDSVETEIVRTMKAGLAAEQNEQILEAKQLYEKAVAIDPGDPVPLRFLAELERHHTGDWDRARTLFERLLTMRADPISRAVALHGIGKMTIHDGRFAKGVALFEESLRVYPLALTYRNLAVYWNSEKNAEKALEYVHKAIELDPDDSFNQIFAATYLVGLGRPQEAEAIARRHEETLAASYNLAVIHAQLGNREKALSLLRRHFYAYERFDAVRAKEMQEARDDIAFATLHKDPDFVKLTALADSDNMSYRRRVS